MQELLARAQQLVAAGPYDARPAEIATVHAAMYPDRDAVCQTCRGELGKAYYAIKRWAEQQGAASNAPLSSTPMKKTASVARFKSDHTIYTPHGLGIAYTNNNLTDKAARYIIANDPDAKALFSELPPEADDEDEQKASEAKQAIADSTTQPATGEIDYVKLAQAILDIQGKQKAQQPDQQVKELQKDVKDAGQPLPSATSTMTASTGGAATDSVADEVVTTSVVEPAHVEVTTGQPADTDAPVRLSRMNKEQLTAAHLAELGQAPAEGLTNDQMRDAIAEKRASQQDPE